VKDFNEAAEEKWRKRRKKGYNWPKLIVMVVLLAAILYVMSVLQRSGNVVTEPMAEVQTEAREAQIDEPETRDEQSQEQIHEDSQESPLQ